MIRGPRPANIFSMTWSGIIDGGKVHAADAVFLPDCCKIKPFRELGSDIIPVKKELLLLPHETQTLVVHNYHRYIQIQFRESGQFLYVHLDGAVPADADDLPLRVGKGRPDGGG